MHLTDLFFIGFLAGMVLWLVCMWRRHNRWAAFWMLVALGSLVLLKLVR